MAEPLSSTPSEPEGEDKAKAGVSLPEGYDSAEAFLREARERFQEASDADRLNRDAGLDDLKFFAGEQWDSIDIANRAKTGMPSLVINRLPQFVAQVVGDIRINRPGIKVRPGKDATKELADVREGLIRFIERESNAPMVYAAAGQAQVACGIGNFRVVLEYADDDVFDQDIRIRPVMNPFAVTWDPMSIDPTGKDARYCFVSDDVPRKTFEEDYPDATPSDLGEKGEVEGWFTADTVRVTEYWRMIRTPVTLLLLADGTVEEEEKVQGPVQVLKRRVTHRQSAERYLITGRDILEGPYTLPISRVPVIRVQGWEIWVGDRRDRFGLVRFAKDPQKFMNFAESAKVMTLASAAKGKWVAQANAVAGYENDWRDAATSSDPLLLYQGQQAPQFVPPPTVPTGYAELSASSSQHMKDVTGLHDASLGAQSNETSGIAIQARQREGDVATFVYHDNLQAAISEGGSVINELIPVAFDGARTISILGEDGTSDTHRVNDPMHPESMPILLGKYAVAVETGPSFTTKRVEASEQIKEFLRTFPQAAPLIGDLYAKGQDWPMADKIAERLAHMLPPGLQEGEDGKPVQPPPPPPPPPAEQIELQIKTQAARKASADADRAEADAGKAKFELDQMTGAVQAHINDQIGHGVASFMTARGVPPPPMQGAPQPPPPSAPPQMGETLNFGPGPPSPDQPPLGQGPAAP